MKAIGLVCVNILIVLVFLSGICGNTHINLSNYDMQINLTSPNYPAAYPVNILCTWTVSVFEGAIPIITFKDWNIGETKEALQFGNTDIDAFYEVGGELPSPNLVIVNGTVTSLTFKSFRWNYGYTGFWVVLSATTGNGK